MADRMTLLLIGGYIVALALGAYELQRVPSVPGNIPGQATEPVPPLEIPPDAIKNIQAFDAIVERPLFSRERRPIATIENQRGIQPTARSDDIDRMRLTAVLRDADSLTALLEDQSGSTRVLHEGDALGEWQVAEILDDHVVMKSDGREKTLEVHQFDTVSTDRRQRRRPPTPARETTRRPAATNRPRATASGRRSDQIPDKP